MMSTVSLASDEKSVSFDKFKAEDSTYRYFIGLAVSEKSETEAIQLAIQNAHQNAVSELFGAFIRVQAKSLETLNNVDFQKEQAFSTNQVKLVSFQLIDKILTSNKIFEAKVLFRYPKSEFILEKKRISEESIDNPKELASEGYNFVGSDKSLPLISVRANYNDREIEGGDVWINNEKIAFTPLKVRIKLKIGLNRVEVRHPNFANHVKDFELDEIKDLDFNLKLKPAMGKAEFISDTTETKVYIDDEFVGFAPIVMNMISQRNFEIKFTKEGYEDMKVSNLKVEKGDLKIVKINMINKPVELDESEIGCFEEATDDEDDNDNPI